MTWEFKVGQKVVCVDDGHNSAVRWDFLIKKNEVYTIRSVSKDGRYYYRVPESRETLSLRLVEIDRAGDTPYAAARFRPLVTDTQSWLKEILETPPPAPVKLPEYVEIGDGWGMR